MGGALSVRYSAPALAEIDEIFEFIARDNAAAASDVLMAIANAIALVRLYPHKSRRTRQRGMRALPLSRYPYIIFFKIRRGELEVLHVLHGAHRHPGFQEVASAYAG